MEPAETVAAIEGMDAEDSKHETTGVAGVQPSKSFGSPIAAAEAATAKEQEVQEVPTEEAADAQETKKQPEQVGEKRPVEGDAEAELRGKMRQALGRSKRLKTLNKKFLQVLIGSFDGNLCRQDVSEVLGGLPEPYQVVLQDLHEQILQQVKEFCQAEFNDIVHDSHTDVTLNGFDLLGEKHLWSLGSALNPSSLISAERRRSKREEAKLLRETLEEGKKELERMEGILTAKQAEVKEVTSSYGPIPGLLNGIEDANKQWKASFSQPLQPRESEQ